MNRNKLATVGAGIVALGTAAQGAMAATVDTTDILSNITDYSAAAVIVVLAFLAARWAIHATGLLRPKG